MRDKPARCLTLGTSDSARCMSEHRALPRVGPKQSARQRGPMPRVQRGPPWRLLVRRRAALVGACSYPSSGLHDSYRISRACRQLLAQAQATAWQICMPTCQANNEERMRALATRRSAGAAVAAEPGCQIFSQEKCAPCCTKLPHKQEHWQARSHICTPATEQRLRTLAGLPGRRRSGGPLGARAAAEHGTAALPPLRRFRAGRLLARPRLPRQRPAAQWLLHGRYSFVHSFRT